MDSLVNNLLLATESSEHDVGAEAVALAYAQRHSLPLHVVVPLPSNPEFEAVAPALAAKAEKQAHSRIEVLKERAALAKVDLTVKLRRGSQAHEAIVAETRESGCDLLIIRRRGKKGLLAKLLVGEMVSKVISHAQCPILICPKDTHLWQTEIMVGLDVMEPATGLIEQASDIARDSGLPLCIMGVMRESDLSTQALAAVKTAVQTAENLGAIACGDTRVGKLSETLISAAKERGSDLLVIGRQSDKNQGRSGLDATARDTIGLAACPVWITARLPEKQAT